MNPSTPASILEAIRHAVEQSIPLARVEVAGGGGHYSLVVHAATFHGKSMLESHRLVYAAIAPLMSGDNAPVHAVDSLKTVAS